jgi:hypothetical protein
MSAALGTTYELSEVGTILIANVKKESYTISVFDTYLAIPRFVAYLKPAEACSRFGIIPISAYAVEELPTTVGAELSTIEVLFVIETI